VEKNNSINVLLIFLIVGSIFFPSILSAQSEQKASINILPGYITMNTPSSFSFDRTFLPKAGDPSLYLYKILTPNIESSKLTVKDADSSGQNFHVTMSLSNLFTSNQILPFTNFSTTTLAIDTINNIDVNSSGLPFPTANITAPIACSWDGLNGTLDDNCSTELNSNTLVGNITPIAIDPTTNITNSTNLIPVSNSTQYTIDEIIIFSDGEKALITQIDPGILHVERGILGTTASEHTPASGIIPVGPESQQLDIMVGPEPPGGRIGAYSLGFGFRSLIDPAEEIQAGDYSGHITFTLYIT